MFLKEITLLGFKSFPDKVKITFTPGMTCIVGPNGCGKSNITDALRWVFGEQSAKRLRGGRMQDVIFSGTSERKPLNLAEVHVVLDNEKRLLPSDYNEVSISRKLFSDGDSEYFINRQKVRMKDVQELITDTGIGMSAYSFIEQGMISQILSTKAEERRAIFEEAAGIMKYRVRKKETSRKLDTTRENLNRLKDIFYEVERQLKTLEKQVDKAKKYKELYGLLKEAETVLFAYYDSLDKETLREKEKHLGKVRAENSALMVEMNKLSADNETLQYQLMQEEEERSRMESALYEKKMELERLKNTIDGLEREIEYHSKQNAELDEENASLETENEIAVRRLNDLKREIRRLEMEKTGAEEEVMQDEEALDDLRREIAEKEEALQDKVAGLLENMRDQSNIKGRIGTIEADLNNIRIRIQRLEGKNLQLEEEIEKTTIDSREKEKSLMEQREALTLRKEKEQRQEEDMESLSAALAREEGEFEHLTREMALLQAKLEGLAFLERKREGYQEGTKAILEQRQDFGVEKILADYINVEKGYENYVDRILSEKGQALVGEKGRLDKLKKFLLARKKGEGFYFVTEPRAVKKPLPGSLYGKCRTTHPVVDEFLKQTLGRVFLVEGEILPKIEGETPDYIYPDGTVLYADGLVSFTDTENQGPGLVGRKTLQEEYKKEIAKLDEKRQSISEKAERLRKQKEEQEHTLEESRVALRSLENEIRRIEGEIAFLSRESRRNDAEIATNLKEKELLEKEIEDLEKEKSRLQGLFSKSTREGEAEENIKLELQESLKELRQKLEESQQTLTAHRMHLSEINSEIINKKRDQSRIEGNIRENKMKQERNRRRIIENDEKAVQDRKSIEEAKEKVKRHISGISELDGKVIDKKNTIASIKEKAGSAVSGLRRCEEKFRHVQETLRDAEVEEARLKDKIENNRLYIMEKYEIDLSEITLPSSEEYQVESEKEKVRELQRKVKALGNVNLSALEEYTALKERYDFLVTQKSDLEEAKGQLEEAMERIDQISKEKFLDTFYQISENFKQIFPLLFNGGKADITLVMEDGDDILEAGIDVNVKPPGKRLQNIDLLSGGEKALSAIALLFSIFKVKPAPFCVLDEIDAPLDDANIARFIKMLSEFTETTQFIIVSHNKYTMEMADALYGVTMDEPGVSKIVSVQFREGA